MSIRRLQKRGATLTVGDDFVVDASVMPRTPSGNTNASTIAVAERAADLIAASE